MQIEEKIKELRAGLDYLSDYDTLMVKPTKRSGISITLPNRLLRRLERIPNRSRFIESAIEANLSKSNH